MANSPILAIPLLSTNQTAKEATINQAVQFLEKSMNDNQSLDFTAGDIVLPLLDLQRYFIFSCTNVSAPRNLTVPSATRLFTVDNRSGANDVTVVRDVNSVVVEAGEAGVIYVNGTSIVFLWYSANGGTVNFTALGDTPASYAGHAGKAVLVNATEDGLEFVLAGAGITDFTELSDVPATYTGEAGKVLRVNATEDGIEFAGVAVADFTDLGDVPAAYTGFGGYSVKVKGDETGLEFVLAGDSISDFLDLADTPSDYVAANGFLLRVNEAGTAIEFIDPATIGGGGGGGNFTDLDDVPVSYATMAGYYLRVNPAETGIEFAVPGEMISDFVDLADTPAAYTGFGGFFVRVKATEDGVEFDEGTLGDLDVDYTTPPADGQILVYDFGTSMWVPTTPGGVSINDQAAGYTFVLADAGKYVRIDNAGAVQVTVPLNSSVAFPIGTQIVVRAVGAGQVEIVAAGGVVVNTAETLFLRKQGSTATLIKVDTDEWDLTGDLEPV